jgi:HNH endonuclease
MIKAEKTLYGYMKHQNDQMIGLFRYFDANSTAQLEEHIYQAFLELIPYWHPKYAAVIDSYGAKLTLAQVEAAIAGRKKFQPSGPLQHLPDHQYNRHVPPKLRKAVFERDGQRCLYPGCAEVDTLHADHILPVASGGITVLENLQTLCEKHNLTKSDRESIDYRKPAYRAK